MRNSHKLMPTLLACFGLPAVVLAQSYSIDWYKVSGGGTINSSGGTNSVAISPPTGTLYFRLKQ